jgi:hypothetical protein
MMFSATSRVIHLHLRSLKAQTSRTCPPRATTQVNAQPQVHSIPPLNLLIVRDVSHCRFLLCWKLITHPCER